MKRFMMIMVIVAMAIGSNAQRSHASDWGDVFLGVVGINALTTILTGQPMMAPVVVNNNDYYERGYYGRPVTPVYYAPPVVYYQPRMVYYNHRPPCRQQERPYRGHRLVPKPHGRY